MEANRSKSAISRDRILDGARELILSRGFSAMTVDAVCKSAGITKGGFFHHFASKDELGLAAINKFWVDTSEREAKASFAKADDPIKVWAGYLDYVIEAYQTEELRKGCMLAIFTIELAEMNNALFKAASKHFANWRTGLIKMIENAAGHSGHTIDAEAWADLYISTLEGALVLSKSNSDPGTIKRALSLFKALFFGNLN